MKTDTDDWADFQAALRWRPDPVEVDLLQAHKKESGTDIISMLVAIYGSKELFINEYRCLPPVWLKATKATCSCRVAQHGQMVLAASSPSVATGAMT